MRRILAGMIVAALAVLAAKPELIHDMLWLWRVYGPVLQPRPGLSQPLGLYGYQVMLLGYGIFWAAGAWSAVEVFRWRWRWLAESRTF